MAACGGLAAVEARRVLEVAIVTSAISLEAFKGSTAPFDDRIHALRPQRGQRRVATRLRELLAGSPVVASHADCGRVQDPYTLRCIPQVLGAISDALDYVESTLALELTAVTDNPLVFPDGGDVISGGNFHGQPLSLVLDHLALALCELASFSERRTYALLSPSYAGLPPFLTPHPGLNSGLMIVQYAQAALVSECMVLSHPAGAGSIPTSAGQEDFNSMGALAARRRARSSRTPRTWSRASSPAHARVSSSTVPSAPPRRSRRHSPRCGGASPASSTTGASPASSRSSRATPTRRVRAAVTAVNLFVTCLVDLVRPSAGEAAVRVLRRAGHEVSFAKGQTCCGQPAWNSGFPDEARRVAATTLEALAATEGPIVGLSGSCVSTVHHVWPELFRADVARHGLAIDVAGRVRELGAFLAEERRPAGPPAGARPVAFHCSCHQRRELGEAEAGPRCSRPCPRWNMRRSRRTSCAAGSVARSR